MNDFARVEQDEDALKRGVLFFELVAFGMKLDDGFGFEELQEYADKINALARRYAAEEVRKACAEQMEEDAKYISALEKAIDAVTNLMSQSDGVCGLHKNGDEAEWSSLCSGGRFESWLKQLDDAVIAIDERKEAIRAGKGE